MWRGSSWIVAGMALALLAACSSTIPKRTTPGVRQEQFLQYAGPPIDSFTYLGRYYSWEPLGDLQLVVWTTINDAYLLTVQSPCVGLDFATGIGLTSYSHTVTRGIDSIKFDHQRCFISQIRPVDYLAMKKAMRSRS